MSHETKDRTLIGTSAPISRPRPAAPSGPLPAQSAQDAVAPGGTTSAPTVEQRPGRQPPAGTAIGGADPDDLIGRELCGYVIRRKLAEGGMGVVYEGIHAKLGRLGAIKVLRPEFCRSEEVVERFHQEARAVNAIRHDNIVDIYDFGRDPQGRVCFVMEYLDGEPLSARIRRGALAWVEAFPILEQTLRALQAAHDKGFVHRDLKPDNIWLRYVDGRVQIKLLDFGIAKLVGVDGSPDKLTHTGSIIGTPHYMSPEQINGSKAIDRCSDLYALGVIAYEMFAGVTPFVGDTLQVLMMGHLFAAPPRLAGLPPGLGVPEAMADVIERMLVKDAAGRYPSAADVLSDLHDVNGDRRPTHADTLQQTRPLQGRAAPGARPRVHRRRAALLAGAAVCAAAVVGVALWSSRQPDAPVAPPRPAPAPAVAPQLRAPPVERPLDPDAVRKDAQATLRASIREVEPRVRVQGSDALGKIKDQPSTPALSQLTETDRDDEVRGHAADALGVIGAAQLAPLLARLESAAPPPLQVWYASALARLGDKAAARRLLGHARSKDLAIAFKAALTLAELSRPGDQPVLAALRALAAHEAELSAVAPYAGALILTRMAALRDAPARKLLHALLDHRDEGVRLAAAEGLARIGDDAGKQVLHDVLANPASPNRLVAAVAQIPLGEYSGFDLITAQLSASGPGIRRLAARGLGEIGEHKSLRALIAAASDRDWTVRIAAAAAIVAIVGLDPQVLAQASVDWTKSALESQDWAVRKAAAGVLADIPEKQAVPLLAQAIADPDPGVRLAASRSAGKMKSAEAAAKVAAAVTTETDPRVKEQQVKALGEIGSPTAHDTLAQLSGEPGRIGVFAAGSLIAVGDASGKARLDAAVVDQNSDLRLAAVEAASTANNPVVVPTLQVGVLDRVFAIRFTAAEALAALHDKASALPVLNEGLASKDDGVYGRAVAALTRLGEKLRDTLRTPAEMLDSPDPRQRLAAVPAVRTLPTGDAVPLLRRLVADLDPDVRHAGVDAIEVVSASDKDAAVKLYKPLVNDADPVVRSKAAGQLARLAPPPPAIAPPQPPVPSPPPDDKLPKVKLALDGATAAAAEARTADEAFAAAAADLATAIATPARDATAAQHVEALATRVDEAAGKLEAVAARAEAAAQAVSDAAGASPSPDAASLVADARALAQRAREAATGARGKTTEAAAQARGYVQRETGDPQFYIAAADAAIASGNLAEAKHKLDAAAQLLRKSGTKRPGLDQSYGQLYDQMARRSADPAARRKLLQQAEAAYRRFAAAGTGPLVQRANDRLAEIADELKELGSP